MSLSEDLYKTSQRHLVPAEIGPYFIENQKHHQVEQRIVSTKNIKSSICIHRSCHWRGFKNSVRKVYAIFTGKHLCWSLFFLKKAETPARCFPLNIAKILRTSTLKNICEQLLLYLFFLSLRRENLCHNLIKDEWKEQ